MARSINKVVLIGAGGTVGSAVLDALLAADFTVTIVTRPESTTRFKPDVPVIRCTYDEPSLQHAFTGQDAVVCCIGIPGLQYEKTMIDAAAAAGVKRFVVDEFANSPKQVGFSDFEFARVVKREILEHARMKAADTEDFTWTALATGNFIDWSLKRFPAAMGFTLSTRQARIMDSGKEPFTATTLAGIGAAIAGILKHPDETANCFCCVSSIRTTQMEILGAYERITGEKWTVENLSSKEVLERGREKLEAGDKSGVLDVLTVQLFEEGGGRSIVVSDEESDSPLLGVPQPSIDEIVQEVIDSAL